MKSKILAGLFLIGLMFLVLIASALAVTTINDDSVPNNPSSLVASTIDYSGSFSGQNTDLLAFADTSAGTCRPNLDRGGVYLVKTNGLAVDGNTLKAGAKCDVGDYIDFYECGDDTCSSSASKLFSDLWYKSSTSDLMYYKDFYTRNKEDFWATYQCYDCDIEQASTTTYSCWGETWRGEPGSQYVGQSGTCEFGCNDVHKTTQDLSTSAVIDLLCNDKEVVVNDNNAGGDSTQEDLSTELSGRFVEVNIPERVSSDYYTVTAIFEAESDGRYLMGAGATATPLSLIGIEQNECDGDPHWATGWVDLTAGEKVSVEFTLQSREEAGIYNFVLGAYTGCVATENNPDYNGEIIKTTTKAITFVNDGSGSITGAVTGTPVGDASSGTGLAVIGLGVAIPIALAGIGLLFVNIPIGVVVSGLGVLLILMNLLL